MAVNQPATLADNGRQLLKMPASIADYMSFEISADDAGCLGNESVLDVMRHGSDLQAAMIRSMKSWHGQSIKSKIGV
jgi:hypothetical protein